MDQQTRRTFLRTAFIGGSAAAGVATGPWVLRARAQGAPLRVGLVLPYSGVYAELGNSITQAMELVFARENWTVAGRKIEMIKEDDEMAVPVGVRKTEKLIDSDKVDILTGPVHSGILMAMRDKVHNSQDDPASSRMRVRTRSAGPAARSGSSAPPSPTGSPVSPWAPGWRRTCPRRSSRSPRTTRRARTRWRPSARPSTPPAARCVGEEYPKLGETDYAPYLTKIKQSGAKAVFAFFSGTDAVNFVKQYDEFGLKQSIKLTGAGLPHRAGRAARPGQGGARRHHRPLLHAAARQPGEPAVREGLPREVQGQDARRLRLPGLRHRRGDRARASRR